MKLSKFKSVTDTIPSEQITAAELIEEIRSDAHKALCDEIRRAPDKDTRSDLKRKLPAVTASGTFSKRSAGDLLNHSGLIVCDLDIEDNPQLIEHAQGIRERLAEDPHVVLFFVSPSGGLKVGFRIKASDKREHGSAFLSARSYMLENFGLTIDEACKDVSRLCFLSHDPHAYYNAKAKQLKITQEAKPVPIWRPQAKKQNGNTPLDQFDQRGDVEGMLRAQGWHTRDGKHWTRPGKESGISGTLGIVGERKFYCWTSAAPPLEPNQSYSPSALYATFYHGGDFSQATKQLAADGYGEDSLPEVDPATLRSIEAIVKQYTESYKAMEKELAQTQAELDAVKKMTVLDLLRQRDISKADKLAERKRMAKEMVFILPGIAARGQATAIYASPNSGKTLITCKLIHDQAAAGALGDLTVVYCNFDDDFNGANMKAEYMADFPNVLMIDNQEQSADDVLKMMKASIEDGSAASMCFILDTLIRFVSDSDKATQRAFNLLVQEFVGAQGTVIGLGHTNKHKDAQGRSVHGGTSDIRNSFSQSAILELQTEPEATSRRVKFYNDKLRGMAQVSTCYAYDHGDEKNWLERVETVERVSESETAKIAEGVLAAHQYEQDKPIIEYLLSRLSLGAQSLSDLCQQDLDSKPGSKQERADVIERYEKGKNTHGREFWARSKGQTRGYNIYLIESKE